jgi:hypothetical protein
MTKLDSIEKAEVALVLEIKETIKKARIILADDCDGLISGKQILEKLRKATYERLNQLQHEALLLSGSKYLLGKIHATKLSIYWNPRQTGSINEPDLRIIDANGKVLCSAEATTSYEPKGYIDKRMAETLKKLSNFEGQKYYFVVSEEMKKRALSKKAKAKYQIEIEIV